MMMTRRHRYTDTNALTPTPTRRLRHTDTDTDMSTPAQPEASLWELFSVLVHSISVPFVSEQPIDGW